MEADGGRPNSCSRCGLGSGLYFDAWCEEWSCVYCGQHQGAGDGARVAWPPGGIREGPDPVAFPVYVGEEEPWSVGGGGK